MFFFEAPSEQSSVVNSEDTTIDSRTIRFVEKHTVITDRQRKTIRPPRLLKSAENEDPELDEILSLGSLEIDPGKCQLAPLIAVAMASIIDDAAESSCIMVKTFGLPEIHMDMSQKTLADRNELLRSHSMIFNPETLENYAKTRNIDMTRKIHTDVVFLQNILQKGVKSLLMTHNYHPWLMYIDNYDLQLEQDNKLLEMVAGKATKLQQLKDQLHSDKIQFHTDSDELSLAIGRARDEVEDFIIRAEINQIYLDNWEKSRKQQNIRVRREREGMFEKRIEKAQVDSRTESRAHSEIEAYMIEYFKDMEDSIQEWMDTYDKDIEAKEEEILKLGFNIESLGNDLAKLEEDFQKRTEEMNDWLERKAEKQRIEDEKKFLNDAATKIQAWWRGTMVRKKLGPYRPVSKKKNKQKNKKKNKK